MVIDQAGGLWLSGPVALLVALGAVLVVLWADGGMRIGLTRKRRAQTVARRACTGLQPGAWRLSSCRPLQRGAGGGVVLRRGQVPPAVSYRPSFSSASTA